MTTALPSPTTSCVREPVVDSDGAQVGTVREVLDNKREHLFDGIVVSTPDWRRFVDAPEVGRITDRA